MFVCVRSFLSVLRVDKINISVRFLLFVFRLRVLTCFIAVCFVCLLAYMYEVPIFFVLHRFRVGSV